MPHPLPFLPSLPHYLPHWQYPENNRGGPLAERGIRQRYMNHPLHHWYCQLLPYTDCHNAFLPLPEPMPHCQCHYQIGSTMKAICLRGVPQSHLQRLKAFPQITRNRLRWKGGMVDSEQVSSPHTIHNSSFPFPWKEGKNCPRHQLPFPRHQLPWLERKNAPARWKGLPFPFHQSPWLERKKDFPRHPILSFQPRRLVSGEG